MLFERGFGTYPCRTATLLVAGSALRYRRLVVRLDAHARFPTAHLIGVPMAIYCFRGWACSGTTLHESGPEGYGCTWNFLNSKLMI